jgi:hypothetical protein
LQAYVNRCLHHILRIWWPRKISNIDLWHKTNQTSIWKFKGENSAGYVIP